MSGEIKHFYEFGDFRFDSGKRVLWRNGSLVPLKPKEGALLLVLLERRGDLLERSELIGRVWKDTFVEEGNLSYTISNLRKTLGGNGKNGFIETVPRRGYRFTAELRDSWDEGECGVVYERDTVSETVIEEIHSSDPSRMVVPPSPGAFFSRSVSRSRMAIAAIAVVVMSSAAMAWRFAVYPGETRKPIRSIAVLPFRDIDDSSRASRRGMGLADILTTRLSGLKRVAVRSFDSVAHFEDTERRPALVGKELAVDAVLEGTVYQVDDNIRVTVRFVKVLDGSAIWTGEFSKPLSDELLLQSEIAMRVADGLSSNLDPDERRRLTKRYTDNREAYEAYLRGRFYYDKRDPAFDPDAIAEFEKAIELDPNYALALTGLADVYPGYAERIPEKRAGRYDHAKQLLERALALDEELSEAHTSLAWIKRVHDWDWDGSEREFRRAIELDPNSYQAHMWYSLLLVILDRNDEALAEIEKAKELAPLSPAVVSNYFSVLYFRQENDRLLELAEEEKKLGVREYNSMRTFVQAYMRLREYDKVISTINEYNTRTGEKRLLSELAAAHALKGDTAMAEPLLEVLRVSAAKSAEQSYRLATLFAQIGRREEALGLLEKCFYERDARILWIAVEPRFASLRSEPRFQAILKKMNLPSA
jgi:DNA-binding winged helix-turn-helix (wHTH) protein/TolB-like protein/Flp pilus assembly protein TadD